MYLSNEEVKLLDSAVKYFEVGFRSYIAETIINKYSTIDEYSCAVKNKKYSFNGSSVILSGRISALLDNLAQESQIKKIYKLLCETKEVCNNGGTVALKTEKKNAFLVVSELIAITYVFCAELFSEMTLKFASREEYIYLAEQFRTIRNNLSHPEASFSDKDYLEINKFINILVEFIDDKFFWFCSKNVLNKELDELSISINNATRIINNLPMMPKLKSRFVCRTKEINTLKMYLTGNEAGIGRMHYTLVSGFGGMGKTSLVIEVIMQIFKDYNNKELSENRWFDFILFFTAKEEILDIDEYSGKINNYKLKSQITSLEDIKREIKKYLGTDDLVGYDKKGLIVIDNFETLPQEEKIKIDQFITYESKHEIQYVITSRNDEHINTNYQLQIRTFSENDGCEFIDRYLEENALLISLNIENKKKLVELCKGNTLVLVLSLHRLMQGVGIAIIEKELSSIGSETVNNIVGFMSKNAFDEIFGQFKEQREEVEKLLQVMVMYEEPIDKYSLMVLSHTDMLLVDNVVHALTTGLILEEKQEEIQINAFAKTYLLIKFRPNKIEYISKQDEISLYKRELTMKRQKLIDCRKRHQQIDNILNEWQPNNLIDELAILEAFEAYNKFNVRKVNYRKKSSYKKINLTQVNEFFDEIEKTSTHPYIYAQKARILLALSKINKVDKAEIEGCLKDSFEKTILSVETQYVNIKGTISYASILRELGKFYLDTSQQTDYNKSANYSEKAKEIYEKVGKEDRYYYFTLRNLAKAYMGLFKNTNVTEYILEALKLWNTIKERSKKHLTILETENEIKKCNSILARIN